MDRNREWDATAGSLLIELLLAVSVLTVGALGFFFAFYASFRGFEQAEELDSVSVALENTVERLKNTPFKELYAAYHGTAVEAVGLLGPDGNPAQIQITCYVDETSIPRDFGPICDFDGNPDRLSTDCSSTYRSLPVHLGVVHRTTRGGTSVRDEYVVLTEL